MACMHPPAPSRLHHRRCGCWTTTSASAGGRGRPPRSGSSVGLTSRPGSAPSHARASRREARGAAPGAAGAAGRLAGACFSMHPCLSAPPQIPESLADRLGQELSYVDEASCCLCLRGAAVRAGRGLPAAVAGDRRPQPRTPSLRALPTCPPAAMCRLHLPPVTPNQPTGGRSRTSRGACCSRPSSCSSAARRRRWGTRWAGGWGRGCCAVGYAGQGWAVRCRGRQGSSIPCPIRVLKSALSGQGHFHSITRIEPLGAGRCRHTLEQHIE